MNNVSLINGHIDESKTNDMRDKLIELIDYGEKCFMEDDDYDYLSEFLADRLIANGVILPPCKVGDMVYFLDAICVDDSYCINNCCCIDCKYAELQVREIDFDLSMYKELGKTVFLTKEEAEEKLKEREKKWQVNLK